VRQGILRIFKTYDFHWRDSFHELLPERHVGVRELLHRFANSGFDRYLESVGIDLKEPAVKKCATVSDITTTASLKV